MEQGYNIKNKVFYLDVKNAQKAERQAIEYIRKYGGIVSKFLDSKVHYILHNGHLQPLKPSQPPQQQQQQPQQLQQQPPPPQTGSSTTPKKPLFAVSRSQKLLAASVKNTPQTPKPKESHPRALQCKYLDIKDFLKYFTRIADEEAKVAREIAKASDPNNRRLRKLKGRFLKIAFNCGRFRSMFKEFVHWPELKLDYQRGELCPFASTQNIRSTQAVLNPGIVQEALQELQYQQQQQQEQQQQQQTNQFLPLTPGTFSGQVSNPVTPCTTAFSTVLHSKLTTPLASHSIRTMSRSRRSLTQKKPGIYCEICGSDFDNYELHINDENHIKYLKNSENYQELVNLVQTLPNNYPSPKQAPPEAAFNASPTYLASLTNTQSPSTTSI